MNEGFNGIETENGFIDREDGLLGGNHGVGAVIGGGSDEINKGYDI